MSERIDNRAFRIRTLKHIILQLHAGVAPQEVKAALKVLVRETDASQIAALEQELIADGMAVDAPVRRRRRSDRPCPPNRGRPACRPAAPRPVSAGLCAVIISIQMRWDFHFFNAGAVGYRIFKLSASCESIYECQQQRE